MLNHPHIVSIFDAAFDQGQYYIAMELVEGKTLRQLVSRIVYAG
jgi:serine/threonine protein kinase